eukprot:scaffold2094_cov146-Amphora_coffeaeformis.AAC.5
MERQRYARFDILDLLVLWLPRTGGARHPRTFDKDLRKKTTYVKQRSSIPLILRDMSPPEGSIFDPAKKWEEEKDRRARKAEAQAEADQAAKGAGKKKGGGGG